MKLFLTAVCFAVCSNAFCFNKQEFDKQIEKSVRDFIKKNNVSGLAIGVIKASYDLEEPLNKIYTFGDAQRSPQITIKDSTVFRLGSVSEIFLGLLLAKALDDKKMQLDDKARTHLSRSFKLPNYHEDEISIRDLAFHTSSLPNEPTTIMRRYQASCYEIRNYLKTYKLPKTPGYRYERSDLGYSVLAQCLEYRYKEKIDELLSHQIFDELGMELTSLKEFKKQYSKLAKGYRGVKLVSDEKVDKGYSFFAPSTAVLTTPKDMQKLMEFFLSMKESILTKNLTTFYKNHKVIPHQLIDKIAFGPKLSKLSFSSSLPTYKISSLYHGFSAALSFIPDTKTSVFILSNTEESVDKLSDTILGYLND